MFTKPFSLFQYCPSLFRPFTCSPVPKNQYNQFKDTTKYVHTPESVDSSSVSLCVPIYYSSTFKLRDTQHGADLANDKVAPGSGPYLYHRWGNPTNKVVEDHIAKLEGGYGSILTSSGMAAISTVLISLLKSGDHVVLPGSAYSGTLELANHILKSFGVEITFLQNYDIENYQKSIQKNTKLIYGETPCNPNLQILNLEEFGKIGKKNSIMTVVDGTFGSPYNQKPLEHGIDISIHSGTKYLGGHSDVLCGVITAAREEIFFPLKEKWRILGGILSPMDAFLMERGLKTLGVRMEVHNSNALAMARYLEKHPKVLKVLYPGLPSHPQHKIALQNMKGFGGMLSFELKGGLEAGKRFMESLKLITLAVSLGGVESLIVHAASMTHSSVPRENRLAVGITDGLIRFSVGIENIDDLIQDVEQALKMV